MPAVGNLRGLQESIFSLFRGPQLNFGKDPKIGRIILELPIFIYSPCWESLELVRGHSLDRKDRTSRLAPEWLCLAFRDQDGAPAPSPLCCQVSRKLETICGSSELHSCTFGASWVTVRLPTRLSQRGEIRKLGIIKFNTQIHIF